jgi:hypothetical protein
MQSWRHTETMFEILKNVQKPAEIKTCKKIMRLIFCIQRQVFALKGHNNFSDNRQKGFHTLQLTS